MDVHLNAAVSGGLAEDFLPCENTEGGDGVSLEWLSVFVEDCLNGGFTTQPLLPTTTTTTTTTTHQSPSSPQAQAHSQQQQGGPTQKALSSVSVSVPSEARTKRRKTNPQTTTTTTTTTNSLHTFHVSYSDSPPLLPQAYWLADSELLIRPKKEAQTDGPLEEGEGEGEGEEAVAVEVAVAVAVKSSSEEGQLGPRRCTHCLSYKTPQWRAGPLGPKTLCNACGVRFKSGRLLPEYRPAKSPTFESFKHSNSHKKVMEMRMMATILSSHTN